MASFHRSGRGGGGKNFGRKDFGKRSFGGRSSGKPSLHRAICSECGDACEVPFKPSNDRPVFCSNCFKKDGNSNSRRSEERNYRERDFERNFDRDTRSSMYEAICDECGNACEVPFKPSGSKPVFCDNCFKKGGNSGENKSIEQLKEQFEIFNIKLDRILKILTSVPKETVQEEVAVKETKVPKLKKAAKKVKKT